MTDLAALRSANARRFDAAKLTRGPEFASVAKHLVAAKQRYVTVQNKTGVPWFFIAVVHEREASQKWDTQLGQGDPLHEKSVHEPRGRGPFNTWEEGAIDALVNCPPFAAHNKDWSVGGLLTELEGYNGLGYASHGVPSPYVWSGTDQYKIGKIEVDHGPIMPVVDEQLGCAGLIIAMMALDSTIDFGHPAPVVVPPPKPVAPVVADTPSIAHPAKGSIGEGIETAIAAITNFFRRKS